MREIEEASLDEISHPQHITEDLNKDNEENTLDFIAILIESLATLNMVPETIEVNIFVIYLVLIIIVCS